MAKADTPKYVKQGNEYAPGTRVWVVGEHAPDAPPAIGVVTGHIDSPAREAERRHVLDMQYGQQPKQWVSDFSLLEAIDEAREEEIVEEQAQRLADAREAQTKHEVAEQEHAYKIATLQREAEEAELRARIDQATAAVEGQ